MVKGSWLKPGAVLIDVGINSVDDASDKRGYKLVGDAEFSSCKEVASQITPVPVCCFLLSLIFTSIFLWTM